MASNINKKSKISENNSEPRRISQSITRKLSGMKELTTVHYKVILYLDGNGRGTQTEMSEHFGTTKQRINKICKELQSMDILRVESTLGRNVFWELNPKPKFQIKGQIKLEDI